MINWLKNFFIPNEANSFAPHSLQKKAVVAMTFLVFLSFLGTNLQSLLWTSSNWMIGTVLPAVIVELTNDERSDASLTPLRRSSVLDEAARLKALDMAKNEYFSHYSPTGVSPWHWFAQADYSFVHAGENLAIHFTDSGEVVDAWMNSPTHRENIMNGNYREIGVGTAEGSYQGYKTVYVVQLFGTPSAEPAVAAATAPAPAPIVPVAPPVVEEVPASDDVASEAVSLTEEVVLVPAEPVEVTTTTLVRQFSLEDIVSIESEWIDPNPDLADEEYTSYNVTLTDGEVVTFELYGMETQGSQEQRFQAAGYVGNIEAFFALASGSETEVVVDTTLAGVETTETGIVMYSDHLSTTTGGVPATIGSDFNTAGDTVPYAYQLATQPNTVLQILYTIIALFVIGALTTSVLVEMRKQQPVQIAYSLSLLVVMAGLWSLHIFVTAGVLIA